MIESHSGSNWKRIVVNVDAHKVFEALLSLLGLKSIKKAKLAQVRYSSKKI
jgi:hypothetical protein